MKFSLKWLGDFIDVQSFFNEPEKLAETLTQAGLEVDSIVDQKSGFKNIVVAEIQSVEKHPQADRLTLCKVSDGKNIYSVVCGAKNHKTGDKVVLTKPGAVLKGEFPIKSSRIRGVKSEGMLASPSELGFSASEKEEGIWILPKESKVGVDFSEHQSLNDVILDITVPPNRSDCLSHKGLAREISCLFSLPFSLKQKTLKGDQKLSVKKSISVEVKDSKACPRYCGRLIEGVTVKESPLWLKERLKSLGLKSINNIVDITNFVLWDRGQPLHAFDRDKIQSLIVDRSQKNEKFLSLDEQEQALTGEELTIRDKSRVLALAGVIGGMDSSITDSTKNIFIEAAFFAPENIRRTSRRLGLETDSSYRFSRGIDFLAVQEAMDWACYLIQEEAGGKVSGDFYDISDKKKDKFSEIKLHLEDLESRLGYKLKPSQFENWMKRLSCKVKVSGNSFQVTAPSFRTDLKIKEDLIEEFARLEGYNKIPETLPFLSTAPQPSSDLFLNSQKLIHFLSGKGWYQTLNYSFCDPDHYKDFLNEHFYLEDILGDNKELTEGFSGEAGNTDFLKKNAPAQGNGNISEAKTQPIKNSFKENAQTEEQAKKTFSVNNPISQQLSLMKPLLIPDLVKNAVRNFRHNNKFGQIFELSPVFYQKGGSYGQELNLALLLWGSPLDIWKNKKTPNVYIIKSVLESLLTTFSIKACIMESSSSAISFLHPRQNIVLKFKNKTVGFVGSLHPRLLQKYKLPLDLALAELSWEFLNQRQSKSFKFKPLSSLLTVEKDLSFIVPFHLSVEIVRKEIKKSLGSLCERVDVFDVYEKSKERSVSFRMSLIPKDKSWTDEQLQAFLNQAIDSLKKKFSVSLKLGD